jgi:hypothetical protein
MMMMIEKNKSMRVDEKSCDLIYSPYRNKKIKKEMTSFFVCKFL